MRRAAKKRRTQGFSQNHGFLFHQLETKSRESIAAEGKNAVSRRRAAHVPSISSESQHLFCEIRAKPVLSRKSQNNTFDFFPLRRISGAPKEVNAKILIIGEPLNIFAEGKNAVSRRRAAVFPSNSSVSQYLFYEKRAKYFARSFKSIPREQNHAFALRTHICA